MRDGDGQKRSTQGYIPSELHPPDVAPRSALLDPEGAIFHSALMLATLFTLVGTSFVSSVEVWMVTAPAGILALLRDLWSERAVARHVSKDREQEGVELGGAGEAAGVAHSPRRRLSLPTFRRAFVSRFPTTSSTISRLPLSLLLFAGGIFVLARALTSLGWTAIFASWLAKICTSPAATVFFIGCVSFDPGPVALS